MSRVWTKRPPSAAAASEEVKAYSVRYVEPPSAARTKLADFLNILLGDFDPLQNFRSQPMVKPWIAQPTLKVLEGIPPKEKTSK